MSLDVVCNSIIANTYVDMHQGDKDLPWLHYKVILQLLLLSSSCSDHGKKSIMLPHLIALHIQKSKMSNCKNIITFIAKHKYSWGHYSHEACPQTFTKHKNHMHFSSFLISMIPSGYLLNIKKNKPVVSFSNTECILRQTITFS